MSMSMQSKIIMALDGIKPVSVADVANTVMGQNKINMKKCEARCKYQLELLAEAEIAESFFDGKRRLYKLRDGAEILDGTIKLNGKDGKEKYTENVNKVLRLMLSDGDIVIKILV